MYTTATPQHCAQALDPPLPHPRDKQERLAKSRGGPTESQLLVTNRSPNFVPKNLFFQLILQDYVVKSLVSIGFIIEIMRGGIWLGKTKQGLGQKVKREQNNHSEHNYICQPTLKMNLCKKKQMKNKSYANTKSMKSGLQSSQRVYKDPNKSI